MSELVDELVDINEEVDGTVASDERRLDGRPRIKTVSSK